MWKLVCLRMLKMLLNCMLISCFRFAMLAATDLRRAFGEHVRKRACVRVLWVACVREIAGDGAATSVRHFARLVARRTRLTNTAASTELGKRLRDNMAMIGDRCKRQRERERRGDG